MEDENKGLLLESRDRYKLAMDASETFRKMAESSLGFLVGEQWPGENSNERTLDGRPSLVINRLPQLSRLVANEITRSKPGMAVYPVDSHADVNTAQLFMGIFRHIERVKDSSVAYGTATDNQVRAGMGHFGFNTRYARKDSFEQEICLRHFPDPLAVVWDPHSIDPAGLDANYCFVTEKLSKDEYKRKWPRSRTANADFSLYGRGYDSDWITRDSVLVAEYWHVERSYRTLVQLNNGNIGFRKDFLERWDPGELASMVLKKRKVEDRTVKVTTLNGYEVLQEDEWPGSWIPIIPVYGEVVWVKGKAIIRGLIEDAKVPQQILNYMFSGAVEIIALMPKSPWIAADNQIEDYKDDWEMSNTRSVPVLRYTPQIMTQDGNPVAVPPPQRQSFEPPIQALVAGLHMAEAGIRHAVGLHEPSIGAISSERSGKAIQSLQEQGSLGTYHYVRNFARSLRGAAVQLVGDGENPGLIQLVYNEPGRIMRIIGDDDVEKMFMIGTEGKDEPPEDMAKANEFAGIFDITAGLYDVAVDIGQSFMTQRMEAFKIIGQVVQSNPDFLKIFGDVWMRNADFPGAKEIANRLKRVIDPQVTGEKPNIPQEFQQKFQQMAQQLQMAFQEVEKLEKSIESKEVERKSEELIASLDRDSKERIEAIKARVQTFKTLADAVGKLDSAEQAEALESMRTGAAIVEKAIEALNAPEPETTAARQTSTGGK